MNTEQQSVRVEVMSMNRVRVEVTMYCPRGFSRTQALPRGGTSYQRPYVWLWFAFHCRRILYRCRLSAGKVVFVDRKLLINRHCDIVRVVDIVLTHERVVEQPPCVAMQDVGCAVATPTIARVRCGAQEVVSAALQRETRRQIHGKAGNSSRWVDCSADSENNDFTRSLNLRGYTKEVPLVTR